MAALESLDQTIDMSSEEIPLMPLLREHAKFVDSSISKLEYAINNPILLFKYNKVDEAKKLLAKQMSEISKLRGEVLETRQIVAKEMEDFRILCIEAQELEETLRKELTNIQEQLMPFGYQPPTQQPIASETRLLLTPRKLESVSSQEEILEVTPGLYVSSGRHKPGSHSSSVDSGTAKDPNPPQYVGHAPQEETSHAKHPRNSERDSDGILKEPKLSKYFYETIGQFPPSSPDESS